MHSISFHCIGCGHTVDVSQEDPFVCSERTRDPSRYHLITPQIVLSEPDRVAFFEPQTENPFIQFRTLLAPYRIARQHGMSDEKYIEHVARLDHDIANVDGRGFIITPLVRAQPLETALTIDGTLWIKNETDHVSGSHKARHLVGIWHYLQLCRELGFARYATWNERTALAIASCGNAALAAAVLAKAANQRLRVFIPSHANPTVVEKLKALSAELQFCPRLPDEQGDPCYLAFQRALTEGAIPFGCQGTDNGLTIDGGKTLGYEIAMAFARKNISLDQIVVQVGGGALGCAVFQGLRDTVELGVLAKLPRFFTVQTQGAFPLKRAYERMLTHTGLLPDGTDFPETVSAQLALATRLQEQCSPTQIEQALIKAMQTPANFMWPWEATPKSIATGILDDITYDWIGLMRAMLLTGGIPLVVDETTLSDANHLALSETGISVDPTGSSGLAGFMHLTHEVPSSRRLNTLVLFTGKRR